MTRKEVVDIISGLEHKYPVDKWTIDGIHIWPIVKIDLFFKWFFKEYPKEVERPTSIKKKNSITSKISERLNSFASLAKLMLQPKTKVHVLFSGAGTHRVDFNGGFINRYFHPFIENLNKEQHKAVIIEYFSKDTAKKYDPSVNLFFLDEYRLAVQTLRKIKKRKIKTALNQFSSFLEEVNRQLFLTLNDKAYLNTICNNIEGIQVLATIYSIFLKKFNPEYVMSLCYYNVPMYSLNYAAKKQGITSVDMQHGGQGELHPAYSGFLKVPFSGYNILPKVFWCWDEASAQVIRAWTARQRYHKVVVGGNPWINYALTQSNNYTFPDQKIILFTLQYSHLEPYIIEAIKKTPPGYQWWLRAHPRKKQDFENIKVQLAAEKLLQSVNTEDATQWPLPIILSKSSVHISMFSGSVIEAAQIGVPNIIIDPVGVNAYNELIKEKKAVACLNKDGDELIARIVDVSKTTQTHKDVESISIHNILNAL